MFFKSRSKRIISLAIIMGFIFISGCSKYNSVVLNNTTYSAIKKYLEEDIMKASFGGKIFVSFQVLGTRKNEIYVWALIKEYYKENNSTKAGSGQAGPLVLKFNNSVNDVIIGHTSPSDGTAYKDDVKKMFPKCLHDIILAFPTAESSRCLDNNIIEQIVEWEKQ